MFTCSVCGKKFKTMQALGGHVGHAHPQHKAEDVVMNNTPDPAEAEEETGAVPEDTPETQPAENGPGVMENIRKLRSQGYTARQVKDEFGYARSTVDQVFAEYIQPEGKAEDDDREAGLPVTTKGTEIITPEAIMQRLANGSDDWHLRLEGMMLLRAAQRMNRDDIEMTRMQAEADATRIRPILELMKETRLEQDAAAQRAKESSMEIAERTAYETAGRLSEVITQNNGRITDSINQIRQAMGGKEENPLGQILNSIQSLQQMMQMFGVSMPGMGGTQGASSETAQWQPPPITKRKRSESQGGEKNVRPVTEDDGNSASP